MNSFQYALFVRRELRAAAKREGMVSVQLYGHFLRSYFAKRVGIEEYMILRLYRYSIPEVKRYFVFRDLPHIQRELNIGATAEEERQLNEKHTFNSLMREFVHREWLYLPDSSKEEVCDFFRRNGRAFLKPVDGCVGEHIAVIRAEEFDPEAFMSEHGRDNSVLEAVIVQHPAMAELNPDSVNTVRVVTARKNGHVCIVGCALRCGGAGSYVDNFHNGGSAYPLDPETGIVVGPGCAHNGERLLASPATGKVVVGFCVPNWERLLEVVREAALIPEHFGYLAWDVAVTGTDAELVEVNLITPGNIIFQLDGNPAYTRLCAFIEQNT